MDGKRTIRDVALLLSVAGICFLLNLGGPKLWDRDEPRNAGCAAEMLAAGNWVVPTFNAKLREHKPVLTYWLMMFSYLTFGVNEFSARFPSALLGMGTVLLTYFIGRRLFNSSVGLWAAGGLATTMMFGVAARAATPDAPLIFFSTLAIAAYIWGTTRSEAEREGGAAPAGEFGPFARLFPENWGIILLMYGAMGFAVLAKGPVGMVLPTAVIGMFLLLQRLPAATASEKPATWVTRCLRLLAPFEPRHFLKTCWSMRPITALACASLIALPWYILVHLQSNGAWTEGFFLTHNLGRAMHAMDGHRGNVLFYPIALIIGFFPWSIFWLPTLREGLRLLQTESRDRAGMLFAFCWVGVYVGLFSLAKTKLPSYITPCYPGLALAIGYYVQRWSSGEVILGRAWGRVAFGSLIGVGVAVLVAFPLVASWILPEERWLAVLGLIPLLGGIAAWWAAEQGKQQRAAWSVGVTALLMSPAIFALAADEIDDHRHIEQLVSTLYGEQSIHEVDVICFSSSEASWVFYAGQPIEPYFRPKDAVQELLRLSPQQQPRVLMTTSRNLKYLEPHLPTEGITFSRLPYFMRQQEIVILHARQPVQLATYETTAEAPAPQRH